MSAYINYLKIRSIKSVHACEIKSETLRQHKHIIFFTMQLRTTINYFVQKYANTTRKFMPNESSNAVTKL